MISHGYAISLALKQKLRASQLVFFFFCEKDEVIQYIKDLMGVEGGRQKSKANF